MYIKNLARARIKPLIDGGLQATITSGTLNTPAIVGFGEASLLMLKEDRPAIKAVRDYLVARLHYYLPELKINGSMENRLYNNFNAYLYLPLEALIYGIPDVMLSGGSACKNSDRLTESHVLKAIKSIDPINSVRFCVDRWTTKSDIDFTIQKILEIKDGYDP